MHLSDIIRRAIEIGERKGWITFDELNEICPGSEVESEDIERLMEALKRRRHPSRGGVMQGHIRSGGVAVGDPSHGGRWLMVWTALTASARRPDERKACARKGGGRSDIRVHRHCA
ncbi:MULTISPECIES: RNA polymerase sigma factor region1.1 domain-containing protein [unclassified Bradyrhizobium]|uniref:RNA polymerase sigma factor region1.1 domain-containing protein n=1 Tax=unclassified Bradyrhizobium TaxID=2631580 RepID=UPI00291630A4|nr:MULTISPECIES: RNA polymerase sigma factor region1.1 domain-containing protein [unclassified Bradyrhizobium]